MKTNEKIGKKHQISVYIDSELLNFIDNMVERKIFRNRSHAIEYCVSMIMNIIRKKEKEFAKEVSKLF